MKKEEFEEDVRRILTAFGWDARRPLNVEHQTQTHDGLGVPLQGGPIDIFCIEVRSGHFSLGVNRRVAQITQELDISLYEIIDVHVDRETDLSIGNTKGVVCFHHSAFEQSIDNWNLSPASELLLVRALFNLGYDIERLCEKSGIEISVEERLKWEWAKREGRSGQE